MWKILTPMRLFSIATLTPAALLGMAAIYGGWWILAAVVFLTALTACLDEMVHHITPPTPEVEFPVAARLSILLGLAHFVVLALVVDALANQSLGIFAKGGLFLSAGFFFGQVSNSNAHELIHRGSRIAHRLGKWVYISLLVRAPHIGACAGASPAMWRPLRGPVDLAARRKLLPLCVLRAWRGSFRKGLDGRNRTAKPHRCAAYLPPPLRQPMSLGAIGFILALRRLIGGIKGAADLRGAGRFRHLATAPLGLRPALRPDAPHDRWQGRARRPRAIAGTARIGSASAVMLNAPRHSDHHAHPSAALRHAGHP